MTHTRLELCNMIRMEAEHTKDTGFPLEVFPQTVQSVILDMVRYENYKTEFIATAMLSAVSAALGGTYRIRIKGEWQSNAALYIILVGRPGLGKTPPLEAAYRPIRKHDYALFKAYESELETWKAAGESGRKPVLRRTVVSDFTPESLLLTHNNNPRSVVILVDEIMGMFNSANRYTNGQLIEQLLTAWSGGALDVTRVGSTVPVHIEQPCINIIGTTQTKRVHELLTKGFEENGLLDRILFVLPKSREVPKWTDWDDGGEDRASMAAARWEQILGKVLALDYDTGEEERMPHVLSMDREAREYFFSWWNRKVERINRIEDDAQVESREMKHPAQVARLALLMQVLRYAIDESHLQSVDTASVKAAVRHKGTRIKYRHGLEFYTRAGLLFIRLPSGRAIAYARPGIALETEYNRETLIYEGTTLSGGWGRCYTWGGKLVENIVQATARDCLAIAMLRLDEAGYKIVMHVHDEVILEMPYGRGSLEEAAGIMGQPIDWAPGLLLRADGYETPYYRKD